jgi:FMN phosphatase YigB (HAD superfamily)
VARLKRWTYSAWLFVSSRRTPGDAIVEQSIMMGIPYRSVRSGCRLAVGGVRLPFALLRSGDVKHWKLITVDVFATLLSRSGDDEAAWREGTWHAIEVARARGLTVQREPLALRRAVERQLSQTLLMNGQDPEFSNRQAFEQMLREAGAGEWASEEAKELAAWELEREIAYTSPITAMTACVRLWADAGKRVVAVSDTRYTAQEITTLLSRHNIVGIAAIYASADYGASKFSGKLFDVVAKREGAELRRVLHIGDNLYTDALSAAQRGLAVRRVRYPDKPLSLPKAPASTGDSAGDPGFAVGYQTLGPILVAFTRLLFLEAARDGVQRLAFVARDGELLLRVAQTIAREHEDAQKFVLQYLHLSRRAVACVSPDLQSLGSDPGAVGRVMATLQSIRHVGTAMDSFQNYYNVPAELISRHTKRLRAESGDPADVRRLLCNSAAAADLAAAIAPMRDRLRRYLIQEEILNERSALVDIGWRGSLQRLLQSESRVWGLPAPRGYYLGLWDEDGRNFPQNATGLISDQRRGRGLYEGSAWHAAFLLEAVCRAKHGMVAGFVEGADGSILPVHIEKGGTREAEREAEYTQDRIQEGVLAYARWFAATSPVSVIDDAAIRRESQRRLYKLAFFPTRNEAEIGRRLVYSEPTSDDSAMWLIADAGVGIRSWLSGLRSPWKGGYVRSNGGSCAAAAYCAAEGVLSQLPPGTKLAIRRLLIRGKQTPTPEAENYGNAGS